MVSRFVAVASWAALAFAAWAMAGLPGLAIVAVGVIFDAAFTGGFR